MINNNNIPRLFPSLKWGSDAYGILTIFTELIEMTKSVGPVMASWKAVWCNDLAPHRKPAFMWGSNTHRLSLQSVTLNTWPSLRRWPHIYAL